MVARARPHAPTPEDSEILGFGESVVESEMSDERDERQRVTSESAVSPCVGITVSIRTIDGSHIDPYSVGTVGRKLLPVWRPCPTVRVGPLLSSSSSYGDMVMRALLSRGPSPWLAGATQPASRGTIARAPLAQPAAAHPPACCHRPSRTQRELRAGRRARAPMVVRTWCKNVEDVSE